VREFQITDSGPQIGTVKENLLEYFPPILIWLGLVRLLNPRKGDYIEVATTMWLLHFAKRCLETIFVHQYSRPTVPIFSWKDNSALKNWSYYWVFSLIIALSVIHASHSYGYDSSSIQEAGIYLFVMSEVANGYCHLALRRLRSKGSMKHLTPTGFFFNRIVSPNYTFEILAWVGFAMYTQVIAAILFLIVGGVQMFVWADKKRREFDLPHRGRITPFKIL
jgi:very-long-chain enoyl-CoA reductase